MKSLICNVPRDIEKVNFSYDSEAQTLFSVLWCFPLKLEDPDLTLNSLIFKSGEKDGTVGLALDSEGLGKIKVGGDFLP